GRAEARGLARDVLPLGRRRRALGGVRAPATLARHRRRARVVLRRRGRGVRPLCARADAGAVRARGRDLARGAMSATEAMIAALGPNRRADTWATVGSGAQIGADVHLAGGVGIGGVLEPPGARPVIVEDGAFIGSRSIIVEGVRIGREAVLAPNVTLTASVPIIDVTGPEPVEHRGYVPPRSIVVPGTRPKEFPAGMYHLACALIIGRRSEATDRKTSLNDALREYEI